MNWQKLFTMQKQLDSYIETNQNVVGKDLFQEKILALFVEIGELANETRCFKFWSTKSKSEEEVILAEYVDGLHFILSLGIDSGYQYEPLATEQNSNNETEQFNQVFEACNSFKQDPTQTNYQNMFKCYLQLGQTIGFDEKSVYTAYLKKNEVNYERQDQGY
ncbi:dUTP diphosphatase [Lentibacillus sp. Marseille-P4043]|uniref:dUTP diphosphatase n=1 Tax=Lentibacillus sp. Marseille-P4043 TaxID=2040293 RepID=UPI000D0B0C41|nr:dUTP diphosphatase [Lentibacillus sp. Marseille-P4043]